MNKKINFTFLLFLLLLSSCTSQGNQKAKDIEVRVGFNGLIMEFAKNTPPQKVFETDIFPVILNIRNSGASDVKKENAFLSLGIEKDYTKKLQLQATGSIKKANEGEASAMFGLNGKSQINQIGDFEVVSYQLTAGSVDPQSETHKSTVIATLCYPYQTILDSTVCIDTDLSSTRPGKKVCSMQDLAFSSGQGAPVAVTKIEINMLPSAITSDNQISIIRPQFLIYIENKDKGDVLKSGSEKDYCTKPNIAHENLNKVYVVASLGGKELDCKTNKIDLNNLMDNYVKLLDKKALARCILKESDISRTADNYLSPLKVTLTYGYTQSITANYIIQKATGQ